MHGCLFQADARNGRTYAQIRSPNPACLVLLKYTALTPGYPSIKDLSRWLIPYHIVHSIRCSVVGIQ